MNDNGSIPRDYPANNDHVRGQADFFYRDGQWHIVLRAPHWVLDAIEKHLLPDKWGTYAMLRKIGSFKASDGTKTTDEGLTFITGNMRGEWVTGIEADDSEGGA